MIREIVLDTETTGFDPAEGHRVLEIGCVELVGHIPTGRVWHRYINPERDVPAEAVAVHGITAEFLKDKPVFGELVGDFIDFIGDAKLIIHNADFDVKFLNAELKPFGYGPVDRRAVIDTLTLARQKFPGAPASLDALCKRFGIDLSGRDLHGALLDSELLAKVYLELLGGRQQGLSFAADAQKSSGISGKKAAAKIERTARNFPPSAQEAQAHADMVAQLGPQAVWKKIG
jgi:DNA polymerase III subunit epsilon